MNRSRIILGALARYTLYSKICDYNHQVSSDIQCVICDLRDFYFFFSKVAADTF